MHVQQRKAEQIRSKDSPRSLTYGEDADTVPDSVYTCEDSSLELRVLAVYTL